MSVYPLVSLLLIPMGRLVIAHHKSYHPYRRDNIERVRRDEEEAAQKEAAQEGKVLLAVGSPADHPHSCG